MPALLVLAALGTLKTAGASRPPPCPVQTTPGVEACLTARLQAADADMTKYFTAAQERLQRYARTDAALSKTLAELREAQQAWIAYRNAECGAVYDFWSGGTIRGAKSLQCSIDLTRLRTHTIWSEWLTYADSTPPILPEPQVPSAR